MKLKIELSDAAALDILTTAVQQGCAYWANDYKGLAEQRTDKGITTRFDIGDPRPGTDAEGEPPLHRTITAASIKRAMQRLIDTQGRAEGVHPSYVSSILAACDKDGCGADAIECDAVLQLAVFERVIYG